MDLTDKERRVYTAALMGLVHRSAGAMFTIGDEDVRNVIMRLRYKHLMLNDLTADIRLPSNRYEAGMEPGIDAEHYQKWAREQPWWRDD